MTMTSSGSRIRPSRPTLTAALERPVSAAARAWALLPAFVVLAVLLLIPAIGCAAELDLASIDVPDGFVIEVFADGLSDARSLASGADGTIYVGTRRAGAVYAVRDNDGDGRADAKWTLVEGLNMPNGVAVRDGSLWVAEVNRILRFDRIAERLADPGKPIVVRDDLPEKKHHGWKFIAFGPDGKLYVPVGAPCNICDEEDPFATILRMDPDGTNQQVFARGVRNTVGFDWHPTSGDLWFTENGRDMMGDDLPADELNRVTELGQDFGFPSCHATSIPDPEFGGDAACRGKVAPALELGPHVAALGMRFYQGDQFPASYRGKAFIAEHGSWNRSKKIGYRVMTVDVDPAGVASNYRVFAEGWLEGSKNWGRPVDLLFLPDGSMLLSDDQADAIYRISYPAGAR